MIVDAHVAIGEVYRIPARQLVIRSDSGTILGVVHKWGPTGWTMVRASDPDFNRVLAELGIREVTILESAAIQPLAEILPVKR
jgi:hypothetical protein